MYKFEIGQKVCGKYTGKIFVIENRQVINGNNYYSDGGSYLWEKTLKSYTLACPVCNKEIKLDKKSKFLEHKIDSVLCYGSFMPGVGDD